MSQEQTNLQDKSHQAIHGKQTKKEEAAKKEDMKSSKPPKSYVNTSLNNEEVIISNPLQQQFKPTTLTAANNTSQQCQLEQFPSTTGYVKQHKPNDASLELNVETPIQHQDLEDSRITDNQNYIPLSSVKSNINYHSQPSILTSYVKDHSHSPSGEAIESSGSQCLQPSLNSVTSNANWNYQTPVSRMSSLPPQQQNLTFLNNQHSQQLTKPHIFQQMIPLQQQTNPSFFNENLQVTKQNFQSQILNTQSPPVLPFYQPSLLYHPYQQPLPVISYQQQSIMQPIQNQFYNEQLQLQSNIQLLQYQLHLQHQQSLQCQQFNHRSSQLPLTIEECHSKIKALTGVSINSVVYDYYIYLFFNNA